MRYRKNKCRLNVPDGFRIQDSTCGKLREPVSAPENKLNIDKCQNDIESSTANLSLTSSGKEHIGGDERRVRPVSSIASVGMWRRMVQSLACRQQSSNKTAEKVAGLYKIQDSSAETIGLFVRCVLSDQTSFPGKACIALHSAFINAKFESHRDTLLQCRECLNEIASALLSVLHLDDELFSDQSTIEAMASAIDNYVLRLSHKSMYKKVFEAARSITEDDDINLNRRQNERQTITSSILAAANGSNDTEDPKSSPVFCALSLIASEVTPSRKLQHLCDALRILSSASISGIKRSEISETEYTALSSSSSSTAAATTAEAGTETGAETALSESTKFSKENEADADTLIDSLVHVITDPSWNISIENGNGGERVLFCAECCFLETMTMKSEGSWALGMQSYALATLKQALQSLTSEDS
jgi:hypothetical protein